jgi:L-rhamnose mutarotase
MERVCFLGRVKPERLAEYRERHERVWPDMLAALRQAGWGNYSLFLTDDGLLVGYLETPDYQATLGHLAETEVNTRWQEEMD